MAGRGASQTGETPELLLKTTPSLCGEKGQAGQPEIAGREPCAGNGTDYQRIK